jgi:uncharacterized membrane protein
LRKPLAFVLFVLLLWCGLAQAAPLPSIGRIVSDRVELLGKQVPLPPGQWVVASAGYGRATGDPSGAYGAIGGVLLIRPHDSHEFLLIHTNALPVRDGWGQPYECEDGVVLLRSVAETRDRHNGCSFVVAEHVAKLSGPDLPALAGVKDIGSLLPSWALVAGFRVSDRSDLLDIRYGVEPAEPNAAGWFGAPDAMDGKHRAVVVRLDAWAQQARLSALAAMRDPADQVPRMPPIDWNAPAKPPEEEISALRLSLYKLAAYRLPASALTLAIAWPLTGSFALGMQTVFWQGITHSVVYLGNELAWEWPRAVPAVSFVGGKPAKPPGDGRVALATIGTDLPLPITFREPRPGFLVDDKQVPLPAGDWKELASEQTDATTGVVLARIEDQRLLGLVIIHSNPQKLDAIFGTSPECSRSDVAFAVIRYDSPEDGYCTYGKLVLVGQGGEDNPLWTRARERLAAGHVALPPALLMTGARIRTRENFVDARYYFAPPAGAGEGREDAWLSLDPIAALQAWADLAQPSLELGVRGRLPTHEAELPWPFPAEAVQIALERQTRAPLEDLAAAGALDQRTLADELREAQAAAAEREHQRWSLWTRSAYKVATYRAASWFDSFGVSWFVTQSVNQGVAFASINAALRPLMAYANEIGWAHSSIGKAPASLLPVNFPEIGRDQPAS